MHLKKILDDIYDIFNVYNPYYHYLIKDFYQPEHALNKLKQMTKMFRFRTFTFLYITKQSLLIFMTNEMALILKQ